MTAAYCTREDVLSALDVTESPRAYAQIDAEVQAAVSSVDGCLHRSFLPLLATRLFDWPGRRRMSAFTLYFNQHDLVSAATVTSGGVALVLETDVTFYPDDGPPFTRMEVLTSGSGSLTLGDTQQKAIAIAGTWGFTAATDAAGTLVGAINASATSLVTTSGALSARVGVGSLLKIDSEYLAVIGRSWVDTAQDAAALTAASSDVVVTVADTSGFVAGELILIDAEQMEIVDVASATTLSVRRAVAGSVLVAHSGSASVYSSRRFTVERGSQGSTAASHLDAANVSVHRVPPLVRRLATAEATSGLLQSGAGWARTAGTGENEREISGRGLIDIRKRAYAAHGRKARHRAV